VIVRQGEEGCSLAWRRERRLRTNPCTSRRFPLPDLGPGEAIVAVIASSVTYITVWTSIFEPVLSTFAFLARYGQQHGAG